MAPEIQLLTRPVPLPTAPAFNGRQLCAACGVTSWRRTCDRCRTWFDTFVAIHSRQPKLGELPLFMREHLA